MRIVIWKIKADQMNQAAIFQQECIRINNLLDEGYFRSPHRLEISCRESLVLRVGWRYIGTGEQKNE